jgi:hypothetical protein
MGADDDVTEKTIGCAVGHGAESALGGEMVKL